METLFLEFSINKLKQLEGRIQACLRQLSAEEVWWRASAECNAAGNLVLHLCGNVRQWIVAGAGGRAYVRERDAEFAAVSGATPQELGETLAETLNEVIEILQSLPAERLRERVVIQGYDTSVLEAIYHVVEHFSMHTGQIIYITKLLRKEDLGFYKHLNAVSQHIEKTP